MFALQFYEDVDIFRPFRKYFLVLWNQVRFGFKTRSNMSTAVFLNKSVTFNDQNIPIFFKTESSSYIFEIFDKKTLTVSLSIERPTLPQ